MSNIAVIGLGRLGLPMVAVFAEAGHSVVGLDIDTERVAALDRGEVYIPEPGLDELLTAYKGNIIYTTNYDDISAADFCFVVVNTPPAEEGRLDNSQLVAALNSLQEMQYPPEAIVITSTTQPGDMTVLGEAFDLPLIYQPQFIALGTVIEDLKTPAMTLYGIPLSMEIWKLDRLWENIYLNDPPIFLNNYHTIEMVKIALNAFLCMKISFANTLADYCELSDDLDAEAIIYGLGLDRRVNTAYMHPGMGYGGTCFPKDLEAYNYAIDYFTPASITKYIPAINTYHNERFAELLDWHRSCTVLGLTYKANVPVRERAQADDLIASLVRKCAKVYVYDPGCKFDGIRGKVWPREVEECNSLQEALCSSDLIFICTPHVEFRNAEFNGTIVDCCGLFSKGCPRGEYTLITAGRSRQRCLEEAPIRRSES